MTAYRLWIAGWLAFSVSVAAALTLALAGIWLGQWRLIGMAFVMFAASVADGIAMGSWNGGVPPERTPRLARNQRKQLREECARITLAAEIERLEREAGLR